MQDKKPETKSSIILTDIFVMAPFTLIAAFCIIALGVLSLLIGVCGLVYLVKSFFLEGAGQIIGGLTVSIMSLAFVALFIYIEILLIIAVINGYKKYLKERKENMEFVKAVDKIIEENQPGMSNQSDKSKSDDNQDIDNQVEVANNQNSDNQDNKQNSDDEKEAK